MGIPCTTDKEFRLSTFQTSSWTVDNTNKKESNTRISLIVEFQVGLSNQNNQKTKVSEIAKFKRSSLGANNILV